MKLKTSEVHHFFNLLFSLYSYTNKILKIHHDISTIPEYAESSIGEKSEIKNALYDNIHIIDSFIKDNPYKMNAEDLEIIAKWKDYIDGSFYIERFLNKHAIFISDSIVYGVVGLYQSFDELIDSSKLPLFINTSLLPYKGKIVYDGVLEGYSISIGGQIKKNLKETYLTAKQNNRIITSFEKSNIPEITNKPSKDWTPELDELLQLSKKLKSTKDDSVFLNPAISLIKSSIEFAKISATASHDLNATYKALKKVERALIKASDIYNREE